MGCSSDKIEVELSYDGEKETINLEGKYTMTGRQVKQMVQDQYEINADFLHFNKNNNPMEDWNAI